MGSFNTMCHLTGQVIADKDEAIMILLTRKGHDRPLMVNTWDSFAPIPIVFEGKYNSYGNLEGIRLFQSKQVITAQALEKANQYVYQDLMSSTSEAQYPKNLDELVASSDLAFARKSQMGQMLNSLIELADSHSPNPLETINMYSHMFGEFKSVEQAKEQAKKYASEDTIKLIPIAKVYFKKEAFVKLVNEYGDSKKAPNEDIYGEYVQHNRKNDAPSESMCSVMLGVGNYAGSNHPAHYLTKNLKNSTSSDFKIFDRENIRTLENLHIQDLTLVNDFLMMVGKSWVPSMTINEDIKYYGHDKAYSFQQELIKHVDDVKVVKKIKP